MIGEMALVDNAPRTATVTAVEDCALFEITKEDFARRLQSADPYRSCVPSGMAWSDGWNDDGFT